MSKDKPKYNEIIFTENQEKEIIDMYLNQNMSTVKIGKYFKTTNKPIAKVLDKHNIPRTGVGQRKYKLNEHYFDKIDTPNKAYILGFLYADGNNSIKKSTIRLSLQEEDKEILERIRLEIGSDKPLIFRDNSQDMHNGYISKNCWILEFHSSYMCKILNNIGMIPNKSLKLSFPNIDKNLYRHFIRGYFDGDGSICARRNVVITITSTYDFCKVISNICKEELNLNSGIYDASCKNGITKVFSICGSNVCKKFLDWMYSDADLYMLRKYNKYLERYNMVA